MDLIARYRNQGFAAVADGVIAFFDKRKELYKNGVSFEDDLENSERGPAKISTDITLISIDRSDPEAFALAEVIIRGVSAALDQYLKERPMIKKCCPDNLLFINPIFNLQRYKPGEGFKHWHCDWTIHEDVTEPSKRVLAWILYCNDVDSAGTEFYWQEHHESAERGKLIIFPAGISHVHRGRVTETQSNTIATGWINAGEKKAYLKRLSSS